MSDRYYKIEGFDVSYWNGIINWDRVMDFSYLKFVAIRAGVSWGYTDPRFAFNWGEAKRINLYRSAYHVIYPTQPVASQVTNFLRAVGPDIGEMPLVIDVELTSDQKDEAGSPILMRKKWGDALAEEITQLHTRTGQYPMIYTRASFMNYFVEWRNIFAECPWWLAHYGYQGTPRYAPPAIPKGVPIGMAVMHQYTDKGEGKLHGMQSHGFDLNGCLKTEEEFNIFVGATPPLDCYDDKTKYAKNKREILMK